MWPWTEAGMGVDAGLGTFRGGKKGLATALCHGRIQVCGMAWRLSTWPTKRSASPGGSMRRSARMGLEKVMVNGR